MRVSALRIRIAGVVSLPAGLVALFLVGLLLAPSAAPAQSADPAAPVTASVSVPAAVHPDPPTPQPNRQSSGALNTGIKVHGHWVIEVKNPDGKVVTHREFENKLEQIEGAQLIMSALGGVGEFGQWMIALPVPCSSSDFCVLGLTGQPQPQAVPVPTDLTSSFGGASTLTCQGAPSGTCQQTLQLTVNNPIGTLRLSGNVVASSSGSLGAVETAMQECYGNPFPTVTVTACSQLAPSNVQYFTGTTITPVSFSDGQTISVTVTISFQ